MGNMQIDFRFNVKTAHEVDGHSVGCGILYLLTRRDAAALGL